MILSSINNDERKDLTTEEEKFHLHEEISSLSISNNDIVVEDSSKFSSFRPSNHNTNESTFQLPSNIKTTPTVNTTTITRTTAKTNSNPPFLLPTSAPITNVTTQLQQQQLVDQHSTNAHSRVNQQTTQPPPQQYEAFTTTCLNKKIHQDANGNDENSTAFKESGFTKKDNSRTNDALQETKLVDHTLDKIDHQVYSETTHAVIVVSGEDYLTTKTGFVCGEEQEEEIDIETIEDDESSLQITLSSTTRQQHAHQSRNVHLNNCSGSSTFSLFGADEMSSIVEVSSPTELTTPHNVPLTTNNCTIHNDSQQQVEEVSNDHRLCVITKLDDDTIGVILSYCSIPEFESLSCTCRSFYNKFHLSYIYRQVFKRLNSNNKKSNNSSTSRHYKSNHLQITPHLREVLRNTYHPTIFVPIRCMQFNAYTRFKDAIIDFWVKEFGFKRLNDAEVEIDIDFSKSNPWIDHLEKIVVRKSTDESSIPRTISQLEILKKDQPFLNPLLNERRTTDKSTSSRQQNSDIPSGNIMSDLLKTIVDLKQFGSILRQQTVSNKFTDPNEIDATDSQRSGLNSAKSLIVANHWRIFDKFTIHIDFQFPSHERHFSFVEMPEITMYYHNFRSSNGNPRKDLIEVSSGSIFKDGVDGKVYEFDSLAENNSADNGESQCAGISSSLFNKAASYKVDTTLSSNVNNKSASVDSPSKSKKTPKFTPITNSAPPYTSYGMNPFTTLNDNKPQKKKSTFFKKSNNNQNTSVSLPAEEKKRTKGGLIFEANKFAFEEERFEYDPAKVGKVLLYFILHDFCPRFFSDYFSPKLASVESKSQQTKLQYLMKYHEKEDPNVVIDYLTINRNQLKQYRNKLIRNHTSREARRHVVKDNCMSMVRNFAKLIPYINYDQMTIEQKTFLLKTMILNHVNPQDFLSMSDQLFMSSSFFGELRFNPTIASPFQINIMPRKCQTRDDPRPVWDYMINDLESLDNYSHSSLMSNADEIEYDSFQIYFDTMYSDQNSSAYSISGLDMPPINSEKIMVQRHILEIPTKFMMRCVTYHTPKNNARNEFASTNTSSSHSLSSMFKSFCGVFSLCYGGD